MQTPMGSNPDRGPVESHEMTLQEADNYSQLLETLKGLEPINKKKFS